MFQIPGERAAPCCLSSAELTSIKGGRLLAKETKWTLEQEVLCCQRTSSGVALQLRQGRRSDRWRASGSNTRHGNGFPEGVKAQTRHTRESGCVACSGKLSARYHTPPRDISAAGAPPGTSLSVSAPHRTRDRLEGVGRLGNSQGRQRRRAAAALPRDAACLFAACPSAGSAGDDAVSFHRCAAAVRRP